MLKQVLQRLQQVEERLGRIERQREESAIKVDLPPALVRILKGLAEIGPASSEQVAEHIELSRNLTSAYLNRLVEAGYAVKEPNLDRKIDARYLFRADLKSAPDRVKKLLEAR